MTSDPAREDARAAQATTDSFVSQDGSGAGVAGQGDRWYAPEPGLGGTAKFGAAPRRGGTAQFARVAPVAQASRPGEQPGNGHGGAPEPVAHEVGAHEAGAQPAQPGTQDATAAQPFAQQPGTPPPPGNPPVTWGSQPGRPAGGNARTLTYGLAGVLAAAALVVGGSVGFIIGHSTGSSTSQLPSGGPSGGMGGYGFPEGGQGGFRPDGGQGGFGPNSGSGNGSAGSNGTGTGQSST